jgi:hypothetical protein
VMKRREEISKAANDLVAAARAIDLIEAEAQQMKSPKKAARASRSRRK